MKGVIKLLLLGLLLYLLYGRWQVSVTRFFDIDEFSYLHWTAQVARGERQYVDFFSYFTPGFMWAMAPIYWFYGVSAGVFTAARMISYLIFLGILGSLGYLWGITRGWKWAILPAVILAFLPMPYDKFLEIRPDNLATLLAIIGVIAEIKGISGQSGKNGRKEIWWVVSGLAYSASLFVLTKTVPIVAVGAGIALLSSPKKFVMFLCGLFAPWILFFFGAAVTGHFPEVWYSVTRLPFEVYQSVKNYPMEADLFFFPNASFYGIGTGITTGLIVNHILWILAVCVGTYRLFSWERKTIFSELLIALIFFVSIFGYVKFFPLKHSQYLIPIAVFIAYYAADGLSVFFDWLARKGGYESLVILIAGVTYILISVSNKVNAPKLFLTSAGQLSDITNLTKTIPLSARVVDLEGRMVFWRDGYPINSLPIDSTLSFVTRRPPTLAAYLQKNPADYIWDGDSGRLSTLLPENSSYIRNHYTPVVGWGGRLWARLRQ